MVLRVVTPPAAPPVSLSETKAHLRLEETADDAYVERLVEASRLHVEKVTERALVEREVELRTAPPCSSSARVRLPGGHLQSAAEVTAVAYIDDDGTEQAMDLADVIIVLGGDSTPAELLPASAWPSMAARPDALRVTYSVGWPSPADVPEPLRHAVLLMVSQLYEHRTPEVTGPTSTLALSLEALMAPYRFTTL